MRPDGKRVKNADPMYTVAAYIMNKRVDSMNMITIDIPVEPIKEYLNKKRKEGYNFSHMSVVLASFIRTMKEFPELNRFVVNKKIYQRNELAVGMVVLQPGGTGHGTMSKMYFDENNTIFEVNDIINKYVEDNRNAPKSNGTEKMIKFLLSVPGVLPVGVALFKWMDKHGLLPKSIIDMSPFHMSFGITNLASIRTNHIYHHCYEFGTTSIFLAMGNTREVPHRKGNEFVFEKCMPIGVTMDERIASGAYFAMAFRKMRTYLRNPELLEVAPTEENIE
ncbi:MAG: 2-oxo acid dehydrogenase subunit E2 [Acutalibacteraceae bacterium]